MKKLFICFLTICMAFILCSCSNSQDLANLQKENEELKTKVATLEAQLVEKQKETTVQKGDVTVVLTDKSTSEDDLGMLNYATFVFGITNNTDKAIKGIEGKIIFKDLFNKEIISMSCDFTGKTIKAGETVSFGDSGYECNLYNDQDSQLYNTEFKDLKFEYQVKSIVFEDGTTKAN